MYDYHPDWHHLYALDFFRDTLLNLVNCHYFTLPKHKITNNSVILAAYKHGNTQLATQNWPHYYDI
jgi:hypothetical protein